MYITRHERIEHELLKWLILLLVVGSIVLLMTRPTSGEPVDYNFFSVGAKQSIGQRLKCPTARCIWKVLETHTAKAHELAIVKWQLLTVDDEVEVWRSAATGAAQIQLGELDEAAVTLSAHDYGWNPVISHLLGVIDRLRAGIASQQGESEEALYLLCSARQHFSNAICNAGNANQAQPLCVMPTKFVAIGRYDTIFPKRLLPPGTPMASDLLAALDLEDFEFKSHVALAEINISQHQLGDAELNLDAAAEMEGSDVAELYSTLATAYEDAGDDMGAARAHLKSTAFSKAKTPSLLRAIRSFRKAI